MNKTNKILAIITIFTLLLTTTACSFGPNNSTANAPSGNNPQTSGTATTADSAADKPSETGTDIPEEIRVGYWESPNGELLVKQTGTLEKKFPDTKVTWIEFQAGTDILTAIQGGSIDIATIGTPPGTLGVANGLPYKIFYLHDVIGESEGLIVKETSGISSVRDLKGKKIATVFGSTSHFSFINALRLQDVQESDLTVYDMKAPDIYAAWERGDIDGAYIFESTKSKLLADGGKQIISSGELAEQGALTGEFGIVHTDFYGKYPEIIKAYIDLLDEAVDKYKNDQENSAKLLSAGLGLTEEETLKAMNEILVLTKEEQKAPEYLGTTDNPGELADLLKSTADFLVTQGSLKEAPDTEVFKNAILAELYE